jgi:GTP pyrophosphokinase
VEWAPEVGRMFDVNIRVTVVNQRGVLAKVAAAIAEHGSNIDNVSMDEDRSAYTGMQFTLQVTDRMHLARIMRGLRHIPEVIRIARMRG